MSSVDLHTQARLEALLEAAGIGKLSTTDGKAFADPEVLRKLTSSVSCALDEAAAALTRMRAEPLPPPINEKYALYSYNWLLYCIAELTLVWQVCHIACVIR